MANFKKKFRRFEGAVSQKTARYNREIVLEFDRNGIEITKSFKLDLEDAVFYLSLFSYKLY
jgi:hypothetical protein